VAELGPTFVLGVDLDGVCGDYTMAFAAVVAQERNIDPASLPAQRGWDFSEWELDDLGGFDAVHRAAVMEHRMFRTMPVMPGAAEALWRLSDAGVWIRIITHRLWVNWGHAIAVSDTVEWLDRHAIPYRDICFLGRKPEVEADCYVDDSPDVINALREAGNTVVVFDAPYNRHLDSPRAETWSDVENEVVRQIAERGIPLQAALPGLDEGPHRLRSRLGN
jgi:5'(3')-deoxyribonucleotidase